MAALEGVLDGVFMSKPKLHIVQELCEMQHGTLHAPHWTYHDEDFGGAVVHAGRRLDGHHTAKYVGRQLSFVLFYKV